jgi:hypothetical protein
MKMRRLAITLALACAFSGLARAGQRSQERPQDNYDGYWWRGLSVERKFGFIDGFGTGSAAICDALDVEMAKYSQGSGKPNFGTSCSSLPSLAVFTGPKVTVNQVVEGLDYFYSDYRNQYVPVTWAITYVFLELKGADPQALEKYRRELLYSNH